LVENDCLLEYEQLLEQQIKVPNQIAANLMWGLNPHLIAKLGKEIVVSFATTGFRKTSPH
jgi:hypothetical protein